ncbi:MAG: hypothetical protein J3K34DRAFT_426925, partial [Monoraphidium minutum]
SDWQVAAVWSGGAAGLCAAAPMPLVPCGPALAAAPPCPVRPVCPGAPAAVVRSRACLAPLPPVCGAHVPPPTPAVEQGAWMLSLFAVIASLAPAAAGLGFQHSK